MVAGELILMKDELEVMSHAAECKAYFGSAADLVGGGGKLSP